MRPLQVEIPGKVYVTDKHLCFKASDEDVSFSLLLKDVVKASKATVKGRGSSRGGAPAPPDVLVQHILGLHIYLAEPWRPLWWCIGSRPDSCTLFSCRCSILEGRVGGVSMGAVSKLRKTW